jgi:uncharacterized protein YdgA (DUF945 family)
MCWFTDISIDADQMALHRFCFPFKDRHAKRTWRPITAKGEKMRKIVAALTLILVLVAFIPFINGLLMETTIRRAFANINALHADTGAGYSLEIVNYNRGYLTSDIDWKIDFGALNALYRIDGVVFTDHAKHGFGGVVSTTSLADNPWYAAFVNQMLQGKDPVHISTVYRLFGNMETTVIVDAFSAMVEGVTIQIKPGSLVVATDRHLTEFVSSGSWQGLSAGETLSVGRASVASNLNMVSTHIWNGDIRFDVEKISGKEKDGQFEISGMEGSYILNVDDDQRTLSAEAWLSVDRFNAKNAVVDESSVRFATKGLDINGYEAFMQMVTQSMSEYLANMASYENAPEMAKASVNQQLATIGFQMMAAYEKLLKAGLTVQISDLRANLPAGNINGQLTLRLLKDMRFVEFIPIAGQPERLFDYLYLKSKVSLPVKLIGENPKLLAPMVPGMQTGLFVRNGKLLTHQAETIDGKLMLNNHELILTP